MKTSRFVSGLVVCLFFTLFAYGQSMKGTQGKAEEAVKVSFDQIVEYEKLNPPDLTPKKKKINPNAYPPPIEIDESKIISKHYKEWDEPVPGSKEPTETSPLPDADFEGLLDNNDGIPPDVNGCVGPDHLMITLNTQVRIQDKEGNVISTVSLTSFWFGLPGASDAFDPRILYDPVENKWIAVTISGSTPTSTKLYIAVSETSDPTGGWTMWWIDPVGEEDTEWMDFPVVGFNKNWVVISGNMFSAADYFQHSKIFAFDKEDLMTGAEDADYTSFVYTPTMTVYPAVSYDTEMEEIYLLSSIATTSVAGFVGQYVISGDIGDEAFSFEGYITTSGGWEHYAPGSYGNFAPQLGTTAKICSNNARLQNVVYRNGKLWTSHHIFLPKNNPNRSVVQWWEIDAEESEVIQLGRIDEPGYHFTFPTIAVNVLEEVFIGYCSFSSDQYASASYSFRAADDPEDEMQDRHQYKDGLDTYNKTYGGGRNRWGDYSATWVDPSNDLDFWTLQEYAEVASSTYDKWGTWWAMIERNAAPAIEFSSSNTLVPVGGSVDFYDESIYEPTAWEWTFEGGTPSSSTEQHPQNIVYETEGTFDVTLVASNEIGSTTLTKEAFVTTNTTVLPAVQFKASDSIPCLGTQVTLMDVSMHDPVSWEWTISPETYMFVNGTDANSQNPEVEFQSAEEYTVELSATNLNGNNTLTKADYIASGGFSMPYVETFEAISMSSTDWSVDNPDEDITWELEEIAGTTPGNIAGSIDLYNYISAGEYDRLISPAFNFDQYSGVTLQFQHAYAQRFSASVDSLRVYVSSDCGNEWTMVFEVTEDGTGSFATHDKVPMEKFIPEFEEDWCGSGFGADCYSIDISEMVKFQNNVKIMFESVSGVGNSLYIDNVTFDVSTSIVGNSELNKAVYIYPNPSNGQLSITVNNMDKDTELEVVNMAGQVIQRGTIKVSEGNNTRIDLSDQPEGVYFIHVTNDDLNYSEKIILR